MAWFDKLQEIEPFDDLPFDRALVDALEATARERGLSPMRFYTPTFRAYESEELKGCGKASFPAFSITGGACALNCDHCQAKILEPMIAATSPAELERKVRDLVTLKDLGGFLLSGGSNRRNEVPYDRYYPTIEKLKREFPHLRIAVHSALLDERRAKLMESAGVDVAMMDVIGAQETIRDVYHLDRPVEDFETTLAALSATKMDVVPHIVIGLHYGRLLGEENALDIVVAPPRLGADPGRGVADLCAGRQAVRDHFHRRRRQGAGRRAPAHHAGAGAARLHPAGRPPQDDHRCLCRDGGLRRHRLSGRTASWRWRARSAARSSRSTPAARSRSRASAGGAPAPREERLLRNGMGIETPDVLVVGLGPAGSRAAAVAARAGYGVVAIERRSEAGAPVQCAEFVPSMIERDVPKVRDCHRADGRAHAHLRRKTGAGDETPDFRGLMIDRGAFDRMLAAEAARAGADCRYGSIGLRDRRGRHRPHLRRPQRCVRAC